MVVPSWREEPCSGAEGEDDDEGPEEAPARKRKIVLALDPSLKLSDEFDGMYAAGAVDELCMSIFLAGMWQQASHHKAPIRVQPSRKAAWRLRGGTMRLDKLV